MIGSEIGGYQIIKLIGQGGMGAVYEALQKKIGRRVALKLLLPEYANNPTVIERFFNEARAVNAISHPGIVQVSDLGSTDDGGAYLVMEYLEGETLSSRATRQGRRLPEEDAVRIGWQIASTLAAAHAKGIVHRDQLRPKIPSRNRDLNGCVQTLGKQGKIAELAPFVDGSQERGAFRGSHRAQQRKHRFCARWGGAGF